MSNRFERTADKKTLEKHQKILKDLLALQENKICADCKKRDPRWASANLGIFICLRCSGIHRSLGVHISKVRSVDLDTWTQEHIENMQRWGNARANKYWEYALDNRVPDEGRIESFIRNKYEYKKFCMPGPIPSDPSVLMGGTANNGAVNQAPVQTQQQPQHSSSFSVQEPKITSNNHLSSFHALQQQAPLPPQQQQPSGWADFGSFTSAPVQPSQTPQVQVNSQPQHQQQDDLFGDFSSAPAPRKSSDLKSNILNLYSKPSPAPVSQQNAFASDFGGFSSVSLTPQVGTPQQSFNHGNLMQNQSPGFGGFQQVASSSFNSSQGFGQGQSSQQIPFNSQGFNNSPHNLSQQPLFNSSTAGASFNSNSSFQSTQGFQQQPIFGGPQQQPAYTTGSAGNQNVMNPSPQQQPMKNDPFASLNAFGAQNQKQSSSNWGAF